MTTGTRDGWRFLGARVDKELFPSGNAIGQDLRIRGVPFEVIGVLKPKGIQADGSDQDDQVVIPIRTALRRVFNLTWLNPIFVSVRDQSRMNAAESGIVQMLRVRHRLEPGGKPDDFSIQNKTRTLAAQQKIADSLTTLALGLAGLSLIVGGIGILALMLMSVKERTSEIGLRMAVGARPADILIQFLCGGHNARAGRMAGRVDRWSLGRGDGSVFCALEGCHLRVDAARFARYGALIAGIGFGTYPARKASLIPPIRALQVE